MSCVLTLTCKWVYLAVEVDELACESRQVGKLVTILYLVPGTLVPRRYYSSRARDLVRAEVYTRRTDQISEITLSVIRFRCIRNRIGNKKHSIQA